MSGFILWIDGASSGPHSGSEIAEMIRFGEIDGKTPLRASDSDAWFEVREVEFVDSRALRQFAGPEWLNLARKLDTIINRATKGWGDLREARVEWKQAIDRYGYACPEDELGTMHDLLSDDRMDLILDTNVMLRMGFERWKDSLRDRPFPLELVSARHGWIERNWQKRWADCGGTIYDGRMIAWSNAAVWCEISAFNLPWPPFEYFDHMNTAKVPWKEDLGKRLPLGYLAYRAEDFKKPKERFYFDCLPEQACAETVRVTMKL